MAKEIKQRIVLEGDKEYSAALKEAKRNLNVLKSELKAETAELGANATAQEKNRVKVQNLKKQIQEQEKVVRTYREALEEVREKYADNEDEIAKYEQKLNDARTALANMKNQIDAAGNSFKGMQDGARQSAVENAALALSFEKIADTASGVATEIEGVFGGIVGAIRSTIGAVWGEIMEIAAKSDNYLDLSAFLGASATDVQKWDRALKGAGDSMSAMTSLISRLKYGGKADKVTEWFGISDVNYTNDLEYAQAVLQKMYDMKDEMVRNGTWSDAMGDILGAKKVQEIDSILSDWPQILRGLQEFDVENGGVGLTGEELQTMSDLYNEVSLLQEKWNAFKESATTKIFGGIALQVTSNFQGALDALIDFMDADTQEERDAAIARFKDNIVEAFTKIGDAVAAAGEALEEAGKGLQGGENGYVKLLGDILSTVGSVLQWLANENNIKLVEGAFTALFAVWAGSKAIEFIATLKKVSGYISNIFRNRKAPTIDFGTGGTGTGDGGTGGTGGTGTMHVELEDVTTSNVQTMYVQNMVGGPGNNPVNPTNPTNPWSPGLPGIDLTDALLYGAASGAAAKLTGGSGTVNLGNPAQEVLTSGSGTLNLGSGDVKISGDVIIADSDMVQIDGAGATAAVGGAAAKATFGGFTDELYQGILGKSAAGIGGLIDNPAVEAAVAGLVLYPLAAQFGKEISKAQWERNAKSDPRYQEASNEVRSWWVNGYDYDAAVHNAAATGKTYDDYFFPNIYGTQKTYGDDTDLLTKIGAAAQDVIDKVSYWWDYGLAEDLQKIFWNTMEGGGGPGSSGGGGIGAPGGSGTVYEYEDEGPMGILFNRLGGSLLNTVLYSDWWKNAGHGNGTTDENGITSSDLRGFLDVPSGVESAAEKGVKRGISGLRVEIDGQTAGRILAPYVSEEIARTVG